ncbi:hypothetical protein PMAYCL1PPCAC_25363, partial [Pristionchus mayeri]
VYRTQLFLQVEWFFTNLEMYIALQPHGVMYLLQSFEFFVVRMKGHDSSGHSRSLLISVKFAVDLPEKGSIKLFHRLLPATEWPKALK